MDKTFQIQPFGAGFAHEADFVDGQFARQNHAVGSQRSARQPPLRMRDVGQRGKEQTSFKTGLPGNVQKGKVLHNEPVGADLTGQTRNKTVGRGRFPRLDQRVHGHIDAGVFGVGQIRQAGQFRKAKIFGLHAGRKMLQAKIDGVRSGGKRRQKGGGVAGRRENFGSHFRGGRGGNSKIRHNCSIP